MSVVIANRFSGVSESMVVIRRELGSTLHFALARTLLDVRNDNTHYANAKFTCVKPSTGMPLGGKALHVLRAAQAS